MEDYIPCLRCWDISLSDSEIFVVEGKNANKYKGKKYEDLYNVALYSAGERRQTMRKERNRDDDSGEIPTW